MKNRLLTVSLILIIQLLAATGSRAQCTTANVNWDNLDYISTQSNANYAAYINTPALVTNMVQTQRFAIGTNRVVITATHPSSGILGENTTHTGESGSFGTGADAYFTGNGTITLTFDTAVSNFQFSIYDLDNNQRVTVTAAQGVTARAVVLTKPSGGNVTIAGNVASGGGSDQATSSNVATLNIAVAGPLTTVTLVFSNTAGDFWMSDLQACVYRNFINNYYTISQPFTGQPAYVLVVHDLNTVYMLDPATGRAVSLFTDPSPRVREINNLAYDPYKRIIYYSIDGLERCTPAGDPDSIRHIKKYDVNTETISTVLSDVKNSPIYLPTYDAGLESGGAGFYNGSLYMGIEAYFLSGSRNSLRETAVWRIDFASDSITPTKTCQVWATPADNGSSNIHDYADFVLKDGSLITFNSSVNAPGGRGAYTHVNMQTGATTLTVLPAVSANKPAQTAQSWNGVVYWVSDEIGTYNATVANTVTGKQTIANAAGSVTWVGPAGDGAEAFRPKSDFGDAPATYDPVALSPALNERDTRIRIGAGYSWEWSKKTSLATLDDFDDGIASVSIFDPGTQTYLARVQVYNNTGANATLCGWLDYNGNGVFNPGEGVTATVSSSASLQFVNLWWPSIVSALPNGSYTYLRIRFTSASNGMTTSNPTGYFDDGETEDYRVLVDDFPLPVTLLSFNANVVNNRTVRLNWVTTSEDNLSGFGIERSADGINWTTIAFVNAKGNGLSADNSYSYDDLQALKGTSFYRLKLTNNNQLYHYSEQRVVYIKDMDAQVRLMPNPARNQATIQIQSDENANAQVFIYDMLGRKLRTEKFQLIEGKNSLVLNNLDKMPEGTYVVQVITPAAIIDRKLLIKK